MRICIVSDACIGYGSPQIISLAEMLLRTIAGEVTILEPDPPSLPPRHLLVPNIRIIRIPSATHVYEQGGRTDYCRRAARFLNDAKPEIVIAVCTFTVPTLLWLRYKPKVTVFYSIESIIQYGKPDIHLNRLIRSKIDLILWPEENRMERDVKRCGFEDTPSLLVLNSSNSVRSADNIAAVERRLPRIIHQGTIGVRHTFSEYFLRPQLLRLPIDIYGPLVDEESRGLEQYGAAVRGQPGWVRTVYHGRVDLMQLAKARRRRAYSVCIWSPEDERGLFAPSNKFFEAIADAVPPITAPHPQHVRLARKYDCGIVLEDWSFPALRRGLLTALRIFGTPRYRQMVENCRQAVRLELNAEMQFGTAARAIAELANESKNGSR